MRLRRIGALLPTLAASALFALIPAAPADCCPDVKALIRQLGDNDFRIREAAGSELEKIGLPALTLLRQATQSKDIEIRRRALEILDRIDPIRIRQQREAAAIELLRQDRATFKHAVDQPGRPVVEASLKSYPDLKDDPERNARILVQLKHFELLTTLAHETMTDLDLQELVCLRHIKSLELYGSRVTDKGLPCLKKYKRLEQVCLSYTKITDKGLVHVGELRQLTHLYLFCATSVTDAGLKHLANLKRIEVLCLGGTQLTDAGLQEFKGLRNLRSLHLDRTPLTGAGLVHLKGLKRLTSLGLHETRVTDASLAVLCEFPNLAELYLGSTKITDAGLKHLKKCKKLSDLYLHNTRIADAGLEELKSLKQLKSITLGGTRVTDAGVQRLQAALPQLDIWRP